MKITIESTSATKYAKGDRVIVDGLVNEYSKKKVPCFYSGTIKSITGTKNVKYNIFIDETATYPYKLSDIVGKITNNRTKAGKIRATDLHRWVGEADYLKWKKTHELYNS